MIESGFIIEKYERMTLLGHRWFFRIVDSENYEILAPSQAYKSARARDKTANRLASALNARIVHGRRK